MSSDNRDLLAELDAIAAYHDMLCGEEPLPGLEHNKTMVQRSVDDLKSIVQNTLELENEYASGKTHEQRRNRSIGMEDANEKDVRIRELERQLAEAKTNG